MKMDQDFVSFMHSIKGLVTGNRPLRLRLSHPEGVSDDVLLPQHVTGSESICGGLEYRISCVATDAMLPLKQFIALPAELQFVTDRGQLRSVCGIVTEAGTGASDGGIATYQLVVRDALAVMEKRINTRIFRNKNELEIVEILLLEWRASNPVLADGFEFEFDQMLSTRQYPKREFTMQHNESDAAFIRRLLKRRGIAWFFRAGRSQFSAVDDRAHAGRPAHTLVLFDDASRLAQNGAGSVRFHRDNATEQRDTITAWGAVRTLQSSSITRHSWDYANTPGTHFMTTSADSSNDQGLRGRQLAASLNDYLVEMPHAANDHADHRKLGQVRLSRHDYESKCFHGEGSVRDLCVGEWIGLSGHPEIDTHPAAEREFVIVMLHVEAHNNLPKPLAATIGELFARNRWGMDAQQDCPNAEEVRYRNQFTCVRRGIEIVPAFDPRADLPHPHPQSVIVVGPVGEEVHCDQHGRVKVRFPGTRAIDHRLGNGVGASDTDADSAWVRVASNWTGNGPGSQHQLGMLTLPRVGTEGLVFFLGGDPDKPILIAQVFNHHAQPPALSSMGQLPGNRYLSGIKSREVRGTGSGQLLFDDSPGQISVQLKSAHGASELNLGWFTQPRHAGYGAPRGEGAELRSNKALSLRGGQGILISADAHANPAGNQLDRAELIVLTETLHGLMEQLSSMAAAHNVEAADGTQLSQLLGKLKHWHHGSNVGQGAQGGALGEAGGQAIVAASAAAGMVLASQDNLALGAQSRIDMLSVGSTQVSAGHSLFMRAARGMHLFAFKLGMKLVAAGGNISLEAHDGNIELKCKKRIKLIAGQGIDIEAPAIKIVAQGTQVDYGGGSITQQSSGPNTIKSSAFDQLEAGNGTPAGLNLPSIVATHNQRVQLVDQLTGEPAPGRRYRITLEDGNVTEGVSDSKGLTETFTTTLAYASYKIVLLD